LSVTFRHEARSELWNTGPRHEKGGEVRFGAPSPGGDPRRRLRDHRDRPKRELHALFLDRDQHDRSEREPYVRHFEHVHHDGHKRWLDRIRLLCGRHHPHQRDDWRWNEHHEHSFNLYKRRNDQLFFEPGWDRRFERRLTRGRGMHGGSELSAQQSL
jgi:hypothetical protein